MKNIIYILLLGVFLNASEYYTKVEPYETYTISSELSGKVVFIDKSKEYSYIDTKTLILKLNTIDEDIELDSAKKSLLIQKEILKIREQNYANKVNVKQLSTYDKNQERLRYLESKQNIQDLQKSIKNLQNQKSKKEFNVDNKYLNKIYVSEEEYVERGVKLYELYDFSKSKLEVFIRADEIKDISKKIIYLNGKKSSYILEKIAKIRDEKRVSTYKVILSKKNTKQEKNFGEIVKVEFK